MTEHKAVAAEQEAKSSKNDADFTGNNSAILVFVFCANYMVDKRRRNTKSAPVENNSRNVVGIVYVCREALFCTHVVHVRGTLSRLWSNPENSDSACMQ